MSSISITKLYDFLCVKVGKETAENLTTFIQEKIRMEVESKTLILATKQDLVGIRQEIADVRQEIAEVKAELIKRMFVFWVGQVATTVALVLLFVRK